MTRAVVFAYHNVGVRCLSVLLAHDVDVACVVTHRDNPGETIWFDSVAGLAAQLATDVQFTRSESILRNEALRLSFYSEAWGSCYVVHSGARDQCSCSAGSSAATCIEDATQIKTVRVPTSAGASVQANVSSILFDPLHGTSTPTGTLRVRSPAVGSIHHVVNVLGRVRTCSPDGPAPAIPGYRVC